MEITSDHCRHYKKLLNSLKGHCMAQIKSQQKNIIKDLTNTLMKDIVRLVINFYDFVFI